VQATASTQRQPALLHGDPDVEILLFPHLYPHGYGHFVKGACGENGRSTYTRHMDVKHKLASINRVFGMIGTGPPGLTKRLKPRESFKIPSDLSTTKTVQLSTTECLSTKSCNKATTVPRASSMRLCHTPYLAPFALANPTSRARNGW
jgi:hypothetical protein